MSTLNRAVIEIEDPDLPEGRVGHEAGGVLQKQELSEALSGLELDLFRVRAFLKLISVVKKVEEVSREPEVVEGGAELVHDL